MQQTTISKPDIQFYETCAVFTKTNASHRSHAWPKALLHRCFPHANRIVNLYWSCILIEMKKIGPGLSGSDLGYAISASEGYSAAASVSSTSSAAASTASSAAGSSATLASPTRMVR